jgi:hypothetical protein
MSHETILPQNTLPRQPNLPKSARWPWHDIRNAVPGEIANEKVSFTLVRSWRGCECGDASASVVVDRTAVSIEYLIETVTGPIEHVVMASIVGVDPAQ